MPPRPKALISWSSGKDSAFALHEIRRTGEFDVVGALTTVTETFERVSIHGVRQEILLAQLEAAGLPPRIVPIPYPCPNEIYEERMRDAIARAHAEGFTHAAFGDLFLADIRKYREERLAGSGLTPIFPLFGADTAALAETMIASGLRSRITCLNPKHLDRSFAGREFDAQLLADLPAGVDRCAERGEFHTCAYAGPMFANPIPIETGVVVERDGFVFTDLTLGDNTPS